MTLKQQFENLLEKKNIKISIMQEFNNIEDVILVQCDICNKRWNIEAYKIPYTTHLCRTKSSLDDMKEKIKEKGLDITVLGRYISPSSSIQVECNRCKKLWSVPLRTLVSYGHKCKGLHK